MAKFSLRSFRAKVQKQKRSYRRFLTKLEKNPPRNLDSLAKQTDKEVWKEMNCLECGNCCKEMSPTYTLKDIKRISAYLNLTPEEFKKKWLRKERGGDGDWLNQSTPCQFLDIKSNMCSIYEVRPEDCAGFPHLPKRKMVDYIHVHKQNVELCPATLKMVEKMKALLDNPGSSASV